ncbi:MAG: YicC family protein, partial [Planctomycetes bacterium]|nr:YicC family protein [Planctomycetota bacterium]
MLLSMTGFGEAKQQAGTSLCRVELRSVNNRHFKLNLRSPDGFS